MNTEYTDKNRQQVIKETTEAIKKYLDHCNKSGSKRSDIAANVYNFLGGTRYDDGLSNYPSAATDALAAFTKKEVLEPVVAAMGYYHFEWLVKMLSGIGELCMCLQENPANIAEMDYHEYYNFEPTSDLNYIQCDRIKYELMLKFELEKEAAEKALKG
jgi:hypothetical protein